MNFKPTKLKVIISIVVVIIWYFVVLFFLNSGMCSECPGTFRLAECEKVFSFQIFPYGCGCSCPEPTTISYLLKELSLLLFPGIIVYFIWSSGQKKKEIKSVNKKTGKVRRNKK